MWEAILNHENCISKAVVPQPATKLGHYAKPGQPVDTKEFTAHSLSRKNGLFHIQGRFLLSSKLVNPPV